jgi:glycogen operon protein
MTGGDWGSGYGQAIAVFLNGEAISEPDTRGQRVSDDSFLLLFNAHSEPVMFMLPGERFGHSWQVVIDTAAGTPAGPAEVALLRASAQVTVMGRATTIMRRVAG